jgi:hypothetical protein
VTAAASPALKALSAAAPAVAAYSLPNQVYKSTVIIQ